MCGIDANLRARTSEEPWIGQVLDGPGGGGTDEAHLLKFARSLDLTVVNTHVHAVKAKSSIGTLRPAGCLHTVRCDYFLVTSDIATEPQSCFVDENSSRHAKGDDHYPLRMRASLPGKARHAIVKRRTLPYSKAAIQRDLQGGYLKRGGRRLRVGKRIDALPLMPVTLDVSSQNFVYDAAMVKILSDEYPPDERAPRYSWMTDDT